MGEHQDNQEQGKKAKKSNNKKIGIIIGALLVVAGIFLVINGFFNNNPQPKQIAALKEYIFNKAVLSEISAKYFKEYAYGDYIIFLSVCNAQERAIVAKGKGDTLENAWKNAVNNATDIISAKEDYHIVWAKADIVSAYEEISLAELNKRIGQSQYDYFYRKGIAFDKDFQIAFLEGEVNGNKIISYEMAKQLRDGQIEDDARIFNLTNINHYRKTYYGYSELTDIPEKIIAFSAFGFICDEDGTVKELYDSGLEYGRRVMDLADASIVKTAITNASKYLYNLVQPDGKFIYGYYPIFDNELASYNILRHSGSIWSLINLYRMTQDDELIPKLHAAIDYLLAGYIEFKDQETAYVVERKVDEIKLGGNGVAIIMLTEYMDVFETDEYVDIVRYLANGILELEEQDTGKYYHVLNFPDFSPKEEYRTVYYDGEATFALARAYSLTHEQKYLEGARMAVENFIANDYTKYRDHWVAYALNEVTKYAPEPRYYEFALENITKNLDRIYNQATSYHTYLELLMISWQTYERLLESGISAAGLEEFDTVYFAQTIYKRVFQMLNSCFYPETAMYMKRPYKILDSFFIRHDNFRVRIDDIQHFIGGFYYYTVYYNEILPYLSEDFLDSIHQDGLSLVIDNSESTTEIDD
ncbi:MAG: glycosyl hydrolase family 88 [Firmicutes bacterium]|nr:glycosyl hydrolase family 88 [Bacillota bacterium]